MKTTKTAKAKTEITPKTAAKAAPDAGIKAGPSKKRAAKATVAPAPEPPAADRRASAAPGASIPTASRREITTDLIAVRAYILWEQQGRPHGQELANWLLAERQLREEIKSLTA